MVIPYTQTIFYDDPRGIPGDCMRTAVAALLEVPVESVPHFVLFGRQWFTAFSMWLDEQGLCIATVGEGPHLSIGDSPRGVQHVVVWSGDACLHDPHPSRAGLVPEKHWWIRPVEVRP